MKLDAALAPANLRDAPAQAAAAEALGFDAVWTSETQHDPFLALALAAEHTRRLGLGTAVAIAFARSPTVLAHTAWDLAGASDGRFMLGVGTEVRPHIERRSGAARAGRDGGRVSVSASVFTVSGADEADFARSQIAFYASTPSYRPVLELHGWETGAERRGPLPRRGAWAELRALISDEMLQTFAVVAQPGELAGALRQRYHGLAD